MISYWVMPAAPMRDYFATLIAGLARRFDAPLFEPHVTIYGENVSPERATHVIEEAVADFSQIRMIVAGVRFSEEFWKTVFVQFFASSELMRLSEAIEDLSVHTSGYQLDPHLSLIYKSMPADEKSKLAASLRLPFDEVIFDSVAAIDVPNETKARACVESWKKVAERHLKTAGL